MSLTLTTEELQELTGKKRPSAMARWLRDNGFFFRIAGDGYPRVDRQHYLKVMGGSANPAARRQTEPNFDAMNSRG
jgi:uncharacterized protein DUF4224